MVHNAKIKLPNLPTADATHRFASFSLVFSSSHEKHEKKGRFHSSELASVETAIMKKLSLPLSCFANARAYINRGKTHEKNIYSYNFIVFCHLILVWEIRYGLILNKIILDARNAYLHMNQYTVRH